MGAGKSIVGKCLAEKLEMPFIEMDDLIIKRSGRQSDTEIFEKDGEINFRKIEMLIAKDLQNQEHGVIATGGGIVLNKLNLDLLKMNQGKVVFLQTAFDVVEERLQTDRPRPLFQDKDQAKKLYDFRQPLYKEYADITVTTDNKSIDEEVAEIIKKLNL